MFEMKPYNRSHVGQPTIHEPDEDGSMAVTWEGIIPPTPLLIMLNLRYTPGDNFRQVRCWGHWMSVWYENVP